MAYLHHTSSVQADFDRIALLSPTGWDHNSHYHPFLIKHIPPHCTATLDIGCGTGAFTRLLAQRSGQVLSLDLSPNMIRVAKQQSSHYANIDFQTADAITYDLPSNHFECIASIATLHHLPMETMLSKMKQALKKNGVIVILDLFETRGSVDFLGSVLSFPASKILKLIKTGQLREPGEVRDAWARHGNNDQYLSLPEIRRVCATILPGANIKKHLLWRYSIIWKK